MLVQEIPPSQNCEGKYNFHEQTWPEPTRELWHEILESDYHGFKKLTFLIQRGLVLQILSICDVYILTSCMIVIHVINFF